MLTPATMNYHLRRLLSIFCIFLALCEAKARKDKDAQVEPKVSRRKTRGNHDMDWSSQASAQPFPASSRRPPISMRREPPNLPFAIVSDGREGSTVASVEAALRGCRSGETCETPACCQGGIAALWTIFRGSSPALLTLPHDSDAPETVWDPCAQTSLNVSACLPSHHVFFGHCLRCFLGQGYCSPYLDLTTSLVVEPEEDVCLVSVDPVTNHVSPSIAFPPILTLLFNNATALVLDTTCDEPLFPPHAALLDQCGPEGPIVRVDRPIATNASFLELADGLSTSSESLRECVEPAEDQHCCVGGASFLRLELVGIVQTGWLSLNPGHASLWTNCVENPGTGKPDVFFVDCQDDCLDPYSNIPCTAKSEIQFAPGNQTNTVCLASINPGNNRVAWMSSMPPILPFYWLSLIRNEKVLHTHIYTRCEHAVYPPFSKILRDGCEPGDELPLRYDPEDSLDCPHLIFVDGMSTGYYHVIATGAQDALDPTFATCGCRCEASSVPSQVPSALPSRSPAATDYPSFVISAMPSTSKSELPTISPTLTPSSSPSRVIDGSSVPSFETASPNNGMRPSKEPSISPTSLRSANPSQRPSLVPTNVPKGTSVPSAVPSPHPSQGPSDEPSTVPSHQPSVRGTRRPSDQPSETPSSTPSTENTKKGDNKMDTNAPSDKPSAFPSLAPTASRFFPEPTESPSVSNAPSAVPSANRFLPEPTGTPAASSIPSTTPTASRDQPNTSAAPSAVPTAQRRLPSVEPTLVVSEPPSSTPSSIPSARRVVVEPSAHPTPIVSEAPTSAPSLFPTAARFTTDPSAFPTAEDSASPSFNPTDEPDRCVNYCEEWIATNCVAKGSNGEPTEDSCIMNSGRITMEIASDELQVMPMDQQISYHQDMIAMYHEMLASLG